MIRLVCNFASHSYEVFTDSFDDLKKEIEFLEQCISHLDLEIKSIKIFVKGEENEKNK